MLLKRIGLLGCGTIGSAIAHAIDEHKIANAQLTHVYDVSTNASETLVSELNTGPQIVSNPNLLFTSRTDIIVESASQSALRDAALAIIQNKKDLMIMSVGALLDESIYDVIYDASREFGSKIIIPNGAIAGLDGIRAVRNELESVTLSTTKHPKSLRGAPFFEHSQIDIDAIVSPTVLFEGTAMDAVSLFPANINVAAALSLSGLGGHDTFVRIIADPETAVNTHKIDATGTFGKMSFIIENRPSPNNTKTSTLAILSAIDALGQYCLE